MAKLTPQDVLKLAQLARLQLTEDELQSFAGELSEILQYVEKLDAVDTGGLEPTAQVTGLENVTRPDEVIDYGASQEALLKNLPSRDKNYIQVKRVLG